MKIRTIFSALALAAVVCGSTVSAQVYSLGYDQTSYNIGEGDQVAVTLLLTEDISDGSESRLDAADGNNDFFSFNLGIDYSVFTGAANGSVFNSLEFAPGFVQSSDNVFTTINDSGTIVSFDSSVGLNDGLPGASVDANRFEIELATLIFDAGEAGSVTTLQTVTSELVNGNPSLFFEDGAAPVVDNFGAATIVVESVAVPEPGSATLIAMIAGIGLLKRRRS